MRNVHTKKHYCQHKHISWNHFSVVCCSKLSVNRTSHQASAQANFTFNHFTFNHLIEYDMRFYRNGHFIKQYLSVNITYHVLKLNSLL